MVETQLDILKRSAVLFGELARRSCKVQPSFSPGLSVCSIVTTRGTLKIFHIVALQKLVDKLRHRYHGRHFARTRVCVSACFLSVNS
jgi:hypothetical protein